MFKYVFWIAPLVSLIGGILNAKKNVLGFYFWTVANCILIYGALSHSIDAEVPTSITCFLFLITNIYGILQWLKKG